MRAHFFATLLITTALLCGLPGHAPAQWASGAPPATPDTDLDALLAAKNWNGLGAALSRPRDDQSLYHSMDWLRGKINGGGGIFLTMIYARDLWAAGSRHANADPKRDMRVLAGAITLYTYALIAIDGPECDDPTAPSHRLDQLLAGRAKTLDFAKSQPVQVRQQMVDLALALEKKTAPLRQPDDLLCRDGMAQMQAGIKAGKTHDLPPQPGYIGKTVAVEPPPGWTPKFAPLSVVQPAQDRARLGIKPALQHLVGL